MDTAALWTLIDDERRDLVALLRSLSPTEWEHETLCEGWNVRCVAAHVGWVSRLTWGRVILPTLAARGNVDRMIDRAARQLGDKPINDLLEDVAGLVGQRRLPPQTNVAAVLADTLIHHQDIRRALERPRELPEARLRVALESTIASYPNRSRGICVRATDLVFETGKGPVVEGPAEALIMALSGRKSVLTELGGTGFGAMAARLAT
jgi:uncharacterized protein (TIGR03083 family)